eukprot:c41374_g1_i1 orf=106-336(-)
MLIASLKWHNSADLYLLSNPLSSGKRLPLDPQVIPTYCPFVPLVPGSKMLKVLLLFSSCKNMQPLKRKEKALASTL